MPQVLNVTGKDIHSNIIDGWMVDEWTAVEGGHKMVLVACHDGHQRYAYAADITILTHAKAVTAADYRMHAIGAVVGKYCNELNGYLVNGSRKDIATDIMSLEKLGRTLRWKNAVIKWRDFVMDQPDADLHWCLIQGSMFAVWEAN